MYLIFLLSSQNDIENNIVPSPTDFNQLSNKFMNLKQDAQKVADALTPLSKYLGYQHMVSESLKQYLKKKVGELFTRFLWQQWKHSCIFGKTGTRIKSTKASTWLAQNGEIFKICASRYSKNALPGSVCS